LNGVPGVDAGLKMLQISRFDYVVDGPV